MNSAQYQVVILFFFSEFVANFDFFSSNFNIKDSLLIIKFRQSACLLQSACPVSVSLPFGALDSLGPRPSLCIKPEIDHFYRINECSKLNLHFLIG